jgi:hypothetical protein
MKLPFVSFFESSLTWYVDNIISECGHTIDGVDNVLIRCGS